MQLLIPPCLSRFPGLLAIQIPSPPKQVLPTIFAGGYLTAGLHIATLSPAALYRPLGPRNLHRFTVVGSPVNEP
jgi:hypothetical protein